MIGKRNPALKVGRFSLLDISNDVWFDDLSHTYNIVRTNVFLEGVTTLMKKQGLSPDYGDINPDVLARAAARGTAVHRMLEEYDCGRTCISKRDISWQNSDLTVGTDAIDFKAELKAYSALGLKVITSEYLISDFNICASSIDKVIDAGDGEHVDLADIKTTSRFHNDSVAWQLSIYACLFERMNPNIKVRDIYGIWIRNGKCVKVPVKRYPEAVICLLLAREVRRIRETKRLGEEQEGDFLKMWNPKRDKIFEGIVGNDTLLLETRYFQLKTMCEMLKEVLDEKHERIYDYLMTRGSNEEAAGEGVYKVTLPTTASRVDTEKMKADGIYDKYVKTSERAGYVTYKPTNGKALAEVIRNNLAAELKIEAPKEND